MLIFTSYDYVIVHKVAITELNRFGNKYKTQHLFFKIPEKGIKVFSLRISNKYDISELKKGDKVKLNLDFYLAGHATCPTLRYRVDGVLKCEKE